MLEVLQQHMTLEKQRTGGEYKGTCPFCHSEGKFSFSVPKHIYKCWSCLKGGSSALGFLMDAVQMDFPSAVRELGRIFSIDTDPAPVPPPSPKKDSSLPFCTRMLHESGLTLDDVEASVFSSTDTSTVFHTRTFRPGTINEREEIIDGDDVIIEYYDLDGFPVIYERKDMKKRITPHRSTYFRVRWQYPDAHLDKTGKPFKYRSPYGSGTPIYIPERLRKQYHNGESIPRLYIQEGEKKAEKASKHGLPSIAVSGIMNLGCKGALPEDLVRIIRDMNVKEVVFLMDADFNDLSHEKRLNEDIAKRPRNFFYAARNYKDYMRSLKNQDIYVEVYLGHINRIGPDKGIDDLLAGILKGKENLFLEDMDRLMNSKSLEGEYSTLFKITTWSDHKLEEIWGLDSVMSFARMHTEELQLMPEFLFGRHKYLIGENGEPVSAQPLDDDEKFWEDRISHDKFGNEKTDVVYSYVNARRFLQNRGFGRYRLDNGTFNYIQVDHPFVRNIQASDARDFVLQFAELNCPTRVMELLLKGSVQYLGPDKLSMLAYIEPAFLDAQRDCQLFYFEDSCWKVTRDRVEQLS